MQSVYALCYWGCCQIFHTTQATAQIQEPDTLIGTKQETISYRSICHMASQCSQPLFKFVETVKLLSNSRRSQCFVMDHWKLKSDWLILKQPLFSPTKPLSHSICCFACLFTVSVAMEELHWDQSDGIYYNTVLNLILHMLKKYFNFNFCVIFW